MSVLATRSRQRGRGRRYPERRMGSARSGAVCTLATDVAPSSNATSVATVTMSHHKKAPARTIDLGRLSKTYEVEPSIGVHVAMATGFASRVPSTATGEPVTHSRASSRTRRNRMLDCAVDGAGMFPKSAGVNWSDSSRAPERSCRWSDHECSLKTLPCRERSEAEVLVLAP